jgi:hypothetical protein
MTERPEVEAQLEERIVMALLEGVAPEALTLGEVEGEAPGAETDLRSLQREVAETLGSLPLALEPVAPRAEVKQRLMTSIGAAEEPTPAPRPTLSKPIPFPRHPESPGTTVPRSYSAVRRRRGRVLPYLAAACLTLAVVGAGGWLFHRSQQQQATVAALERQLLETNQRLEALAQGRSDVIDALRDMTLLPSGTIMVCPLRPRGERPLQPEALGSLVMAREEGRWSLRVHHLAPAAAGQVYTLWFFDDEDVPFHKVSLGRGEQPIEVDARMMPGMMLTSAAVTLEPGGGADRPTGPQILYGHAREMDRL